MEHSSMNALVELALPSMVLLYGMCYSLGKTSPGSAARLAWSSCNLICVCQIVFRASHHLRKGHARGIGSLAAGLMLHYLEVAFVSKVAYRKLPEGQSKVRQGGGTATKPLRPAWPRWSIETLFGSRRLNTPQEVKNCPALPRLTATSRRHFILYTSIKLITCCLAVDFLTPHPAPSLQINQYAFALWRIPLLRRLWNHEPIARSELVFRTMFTLTFWALTYSMMSIVVVLPAVLTVSTSLYTPSDWRPFFGNVLDAYSLRRFWGCFWHQGFRAPFGIIADALVEPCLSARLTPAMRRWTARYAKLFCVFAISGIFHVAGDLAAKDNVDGHQAMWLFLTHAAGIFFEDHIAKIYYVLTRRTQHSSAHLLERCIGYAWVAAFMIWTTPQWMYPSLVTDTAETKPFLPFSFVQ